VTNPLSVKTKVYVPRSPSALFSPVEREKVFLEVHIQNMTQESLWFERMRLECVDGWQAEDANTMETGANGEKESIFVGPTALMQPQDTRQYIYVLQPVSAPPFPVTHEPGSSIPFGRLDISWRSAFGEPGRLLTSVRQLHHLVYSYLNLKHRCSLVGYQSLHPLSKHLSLPCLHT
jgi:hypothetical protein